MKLKTVRATVDAMKLADPDTALNENMLLRLLNEGSIPFEHHGNRKVLDYDEFLKILRMRFDLDGPIHGITHIRTIDGAVKEIRKTLPELGIGEDRIREMVKTGTIPSIRIGNRNYIAMELFHPPYDRRLMRDRFEVAERSGPRYRHKSYAEEQLDNLLSANARGTKVKRI